MTVLGCGRKLTLVLSLMMLFSGLALATPWPDFRGPFGDGHVRAVDDAAPVNLPTVWSETENVAWKTPIPHKGWSSPV
ncbi:MAG: hypothetical protein L3K26_20600, partial [Candidatus Hydrogenedentes bacterium]|nr:hypothetical protein [Candidatus Hydrogenedentota bacterium]